MCLLSRTDVHQIRLKFLETLGTSTLCLVAILCTQSSDSQSPKLIPRSHEEREQKFHEEHHAIFNVKVTDASGDPIAELKPGDFSLIDNAEPREIASLRFIDHGTPLSTPRVVLLLDALNQPTREFAEDADGVRKYLSHESGNLSVPVTIGVLSASGLKVGEGSQDRAVVAQELENMTRGVKAARCEDLTDAPVTYSNLGATRPTIQVNRDQAPNCLNERFISSVTNLEHLALGEESKPGRLILIWIGPGWPRLDGKQFVTDTPETKENFFEHLVMLLTAMREGQVTLDAILNLHQTRSPRERDVEPNDDVPKAENVTSESLSLPALVHQSGGQSRDDSRGIRDAIAECMDDAGFFYVLSFDFPASIGPHEFHSIRVTVNRPGAIVRTNTAYYAEP